MKLQLLSKGTEGKVTFLAKDTTPAKLNLFRRMLVNKVPSMATDTVEIIENSSALYDEMLAHRLGLLVLKTDFDACFLNNKNKYQVQLSLEAQGPCTVYAEQLVSTDPGIYPVHGKTPIVKLLENQELKIICNATTGCGKEHIKFSPGLIFYKGYPTLNLKDAAAIKLAEALLKSSPTDAELVKNKAVKNIDTFELSMAGVGALEKEGLITISKTDFIVTIEPWGQLTAQEIIEGAGKVIDEQFDELVEEIKKIK